MAIKFTAKDQPPAAPATAGKVDVDPASTAAAPIDAAETAATPPRAADLFGAGAKAPTRKKK